MDSSDIVATTLSSLALLVSAVTLYLTYFRHKASLVGCLAAVCGPDPNPEVLDHCSFEFALSNTGTLEILVREVSLSVKEDKEALVPIVSTRCPIVLKPDEVQLLVVEVPSLFFRMLATAKQSLIVEFHVFSSRGTSYRPHKLLSPDHDPRILSGDPWTPFSLGPRDSQSTN